MKHIPGATRRPHPGRSAADAGRRAAAAGTHVRNAATIGGNLELTRARGLESDVATLLLGLRAIVCHVALPPAADAGRPKCGWDPSPPTSGIKWHPWNALCQSA